MFTYDYYIDHSLGSPNENFRAFFGKKVGVLVWFFFTKIFLEFKIITLFAVPPYVISSHLV